MQVLPLIAEGLSNKLIATRLGISESVAKFHVGNVMKKLGASSRAQVVMIAVQRELLESGRDRPPAPLIAMQQLGTDPDCPAVTKIIELAYALAKTESAAAHVLLTKAIVASCQVFARTDDGQRALHVLGLYKATLEMLQIALDHASGMGIAPSKNGQAN
jgi:DNA-binding CsgD family transcriptional regulator